MDSVFKYRMAMECEEAWPEVRDNVRSVSELPVAFLADILERLQKFQPEFHKLCENKYAGIVGGETLGDGLCVLTPLFGDRYLAFVAVVEAGERHVMYEIMIDVLAITDKGSDDSVTGVFMSRDYNPEVATDLKEDLAKMVSALGQTTLK